MFKHYLSTALRNFRRYKATNLIGVVGLSLGLACFIAAVGVLTYIRSADRTLPNADRIVMILQKHTDTTAGFYPPLTPMTSTALATAIRKENPELPAVAFAYGSSDVPVVVDGKRSVLGITRADVDFFRILDLPRLQSIDGNPLAAPRSAVIKEESALRLFGTTAVLGRTIRLRDTFDVTITAVMKPIAEPSHLAGPYSAFSIDDLVISRETERAFVTAMVGADAADGRLREDFLGLRFGSVTYALLPADGSMSADELEDRLQGVDRRNGSPPELKNEFKVATLPNIWLASLDLKLFMGKNFSIASLLYLLAFAVLAIACANYVNMAFAQASMNGKELGLRRTIGASRFQLGQQALLESALQIFIAVTAALLMVFLLGKLIEAQTHLALLGAIAQSSSFWISIVLLTLPVALAVAIYPALSLARMKPVQASRANATVFGRGGGGGILIALQFVAASVLIVVLLIVHAQNSYSETLAEKASPDVQVALGVNVNRSDKGFETWRSELLKHSAVKRVTRAQPPWTNNYGGLFGLMPIKGDVVVSPQQSGVGYEFEQALDLTLIAGRTFSPQFDDVGKNRGSEPTVIIDAALARELGFAKPADAVGQLVRRGGWSKSDPPVRVVGVVADKPLRLQPFLEMIGTVYVPDNSGSTLINIDRHRIAEGLNAIDSVWKQLNPSEAVQLEFADETFAKAFAVYSLIGKIVNTIGGIALFIALLGMFGFALFAAGRRSHEIGVRKTLGASVSDIVGLLLRDFSKPILVANLIGWPLAYLAAEKYLSLFLQRIALEVWPFLFGTFITLAVAWIAIGNRAYRAARLNPADVLRCE